MISNISSVLGGAIAMASLAATLFFLKFWRHTSDVFFLLFAMAFAIDAVDRVRANDCRDRGPGVSSAPATIAGRSRS